MANWRFFRDRFFIPVTSSGKPCAYFYGNSLKLQPKKTRIYVDEVLANWARLGGEGYFKDKLPWKVTMGF